MAARRAIPRGAFKKRSEVIRRFGVSITKGRDGGLFVSALSIFVRTIRQITKKAGSPFRSDQLCIVVVAIRATVPNIETRRGVTWG